MATYIPYPEITNDTIELSRNCYRAIINQAASLVLAVMGEREQSALMSQLAQALIND